MNCLAVPVLKSAIDLEQEDYKVRVKNNLELHTCSKGVQSTELA